MSVVVGSLCTGYGGLDHATLAAFGGGRIAWVADPDPHVSALLEARLPDAPNLGDIRTLDWKHVEPVDVLTAGFPCQDISGAGRRAGIKHGTRSGLFFDVVQAIRGLRPPVVVVENVAALRWRGGGLDTVLTELHHAGYDCLWTTLRASDIGAPHRRERVFLLAWPRHAPVRNAAPAADASRGLHPVPATPAGANTDIAWGPYEAAIRRWEAILNRPAPCPVEPGRGGRPRLAPRFVEWLMGLDDGYVAGADLALPRTAQLRILGNGVVPRQATYALRALLARQAVLADELPRAA
ncbi:MAG TPA: DNA (cytosine-5-)-methyltransferase [Jatrophihabitans sp.]|nr:DNA (cytosine-5-)-methyltransferase [Jatrophihabitans sp.]